MKSNFFLMFVVLIVVVPMLSGCLFFQYSISGYVKDSSEIGISGVIISFSNGSQSVVTNSSGYWSKSGLTGQVTVTPSKSGWAFNPQNETVTAANDNVNFVGIAIPPSKPSNPFPPNGQADVSIVPTLTWSCSGSGLVYDVYFGVSATPPLVKSDLAIASYTSSMLSYSTKYYWKVVAKNSIENTSGSVWSFTTKNASGNLIITQKWNLTTNGTPTAGQVYSSPAISSNGVVFIGSQQGVFLNFLSSDNYNYFQSISPVWSAPVIDPQSNMVFVGNNNGQIIYAESPFDQYRSAQVSYYPIISAPLIYNKNLYIVDHVGNIYKMSENSMNPNKIGNISGHIWSSPVTNGTDVFIGSDNGVFYAMDLSNGSFDWQHSLTSPIYGTAAIDSSGNVYIGAIKLWAFTSNGILRWSKQLDDSRIYGSPVISSDGTLYIGTVNGNFYAINSQNGSILWSKNLSTPIGGISSSAIIGDNGVVYVVSGRTLYALDHGNGNVLSLIELGYNVESNPVMNGGYIYIGCDDGYLYQIKALSSTITSHGWPMFMKDQFHSGM